MGKSQQQRSPSNAPPEARSAPAPAADDLSLIGNSEVAARSGLQPGDRRGRALNAPAEEYVVPFDVEPRSSPGERIIFVAEYADASPDDYEIAYSAQQGHFDSDTGPTTKVIPGLISGNVSFFLPTAFTGTANFQVTMTVRARADGAVQDTRTWTFRPRGTPPTAMRQVQAESERDMPGSYDYVLDPERDGGRPSYQHQTILEVFGNQTSNLVPSDIEETYRNDNGLTSPAAIMSHFFPWGSGDNGTFTVDDQDQITDQHSGGMPDQDEFHLAAPKEIHADLPQRYEALPGTAIGSYTVRRILKTDGSKKIRKFHT